MNRLLLPSALLLALASLAFAQSPPAAMNQSATPPTGPGKPQPPAKKPLVRELFVPYEDLSVILEGDSSRVFLPRAEYEALLAKAHKQPDRKTPLAAAVLAAEYDGAIDDGRALISGKFTLEVFRDDLHALPLPFGGVGLRSALLDGKPASLGRDARGRVLLFVSGVGKHELAVQFTAAVPAAAALQTLQLALPTPPATRLRLSVAGNVEVKAGAAVATRSHDAAANRTALELLPQNGQMTVVLSLNNRQAREQRLITADTVLIDEITLGYERLHAQIKYRILHDPVDRFRLVVPAGFEITSAVSPLLSRWEVKDEAGKQILEAVLTEPTTEPVELKVVANRSPVAGQNWLDAVKSWKCPRLQPLDVAGERAVVGLVIENRLEQRNLAVQGLLPIDSIVLGDAFLANVLQAEGGGPSLRQLGAFFAPAYVAAPNYELTASYVRPPATVDVLGRHILTLGDSQLTLDSKLTLAPLAEDLFQVRLRLPPAWQATEILGPSGQTLLPERYALADGGLGLLVSLPQPIKAGAAGTLTLRAASTPAGWLADWKEQRLIYPHLGVAFPHIEKDPAGKATGGGRQSGALFVKTVDDLALEPEKLTGLTPLLADERGGDGADAAAAYRYELADYSAGLLVRRSTPSLAAEVFSFLRIGAGQLSAHYELSYFVREARTRRLVFSLPVEDTPEDLSITGLGDVAVKEFRSAVAGERRVWTVQLAERAQGELRLAVQFDRRRDPKQMKNWLLPLIRAEEVEHQSAFVSLEGAADLEVETVVAPRKVDEGELYKRSQFLESEQLNTGDRRLIGTYGYLGDAAQLQVTVVRREPHELPTALIQSAQLYTRVSASGLMQSMASYELFTKATSLEIELPKQARLWTVLIDGAGAKPQRDGDQLLVSLPAGEQLHHRVQVVYEQPGAPLGLSGKVQAAAPKLLLRTGPDGEREAPQADLEWKLVLPPGFVVKQTSGTLERQNPPRRIPAALVAAGALYVLLGGVGEGNGGNPLMLSVQAARESTRKRYYEYADSAKTEAFQSVDEATVPLDAAGAILPPPTAMPAPAAPPVAMTPVPPPVAVKPATEASSAPDPTEAPPANMPQLESKPADPFGVPSPPSNDEKNGELARRPANQALDDKKLGEHLEGLHAETREMDDASARAGDLYIEDGRRQFDKGFAIAALEGVNALPIELLPAGGESLTDFRSLGVEPQLEAAVVDGSRLAPGAVGLGLLLFVVGLTLTLQPAARKVTFIFTALILSSLPLLITSAFDGVADLLDGCFLGACALIPYYLLAALVLTGWSCLKACCFADCCQDEAPAGGARPLTQLTAPAGPTTTALWLLLALGLALAASSVQAQTETKPMPPQPPAETDDAAAQPAPQTPLPPPPAAPGLPPAISVPEIKDLLPLLEQGGPVKVPADAIIVPYDAGKDGPLTPGDKILIPYAKYVQLWNLAHPDQRLNVKPPPADYALAAARYEAVLAAADELEVSGVLTLDLLTDKPVAIPLPLAGGVIARATLDGKPARLQIVAPQPEPQPGKPQPNAQPAQQAAQQLAAPAIPGLAPATSVVVLHAQGKGRKQLDFTLKLALERRGGWRIVEATVPPAGASALTLQVPDEQTEVRLTGGFDRDAFETKAKNEKLETALGAAGRLAVEWRPKVAVGQVDQGLTVQSLGLLDVREDGLRLAWRVDFNFGRGVRDRFTLAVPAGYQLEAVTGGNIRGWQVKPDGGRQLLEVTLLKQAQGKESLTLQLARRGRPGVDPALSQFAAPSVSVVGAALQQGQMVVRRSPRVELQAGEIVNLARAEADPRFNELFQLAETSEASLLALTAFQTYRFTLSGGQQSYALNLLVRETPSTATADVKGVLRLAAEQSLYEAIVTVHPQGQPLYFIDLDLPAGFELDQLRPSEIEWSLGDADPQGRRRLAVQLLRGYDRAFSLKLAGRLPKSQAAERAAPVLGVRNVTRVETLLAVLADPDTDVAASGLSNCDIRLLDQARGWLKEPQQPYLRTVLRCVGTDYAAQLKLSYRQPRVTVETISNIKITSQSINETLQLLYRIEEAGVHELSFHIPEHLRTARIKIGNEPLLLQRKKIEPATSPAGQPLPGLLRVTLTLQEDVTRELGVLVEHDRLLTDRPHTVVLPQPLGAAVSRRFVVIENAGRDEVLVEKIFGLEPLSRQQQAWQELLHSLGGAESAAVQAYVTTGGETTPSLTFQTRRRTAVETAGARIEFASTTLVVDAAGAYRAVQNFQVNNSTEQFLDVQLPSGARLWTTLVKGAPVKPVQPPAAQPGQIRIPLIKNPAGSGDYAVEIKYGGKLPPLVTGQRLNFPLVKTLNINVELSQLRLLLPETFHWVNFGGSMERAVSERELEAGFQGYLGKKIQDAKAQLSSSDVNTQLRAQANLAGIKQLWSFNNAFRSANNLEQVELSSGNERALQEVEQEAVEKLAEQLDAAESLDNRARLNNAWSGKQLQRSKNVVGGLGANFDVDADGNPFGVNKAQQPASKANEAFNPNYLQQNKLFDAPPPAKPSPGKELGGKPGGPALPGEPQSQAGAAKGEGQPETRLNRGGRGVSQLDDLKRQESESELQQQHLQKMEKKVEEQNELKLRMDANSPSDAPRRDAQSKVEAYDYEQGAKARELEQNRKYQSRLQLEQAQQQALELSNSSGAYFGRQSGAVPRQPSPNDYASPQTAQGQSPQLLGGLMLPQQSAGPQANHWAMPVNPPGGGPGGVPSGGGSGQQPGSGERWGDLAQRAYVAPGVIAYGNQAGLGGGFGSGAGGGGLGGGGAALGDRLGYASLDVPLPERGQLFLFTTPRGEIAVTAQPIARAWSERAQGVALLAIGLALLYLAWRLLAWVAVQGWIRSLGVALALLPLGLVLLCTDIFPLLGLTLLLVGAVRSAWLLYRRWRAAPPAQAVPLAT